MWVILRPFTGTEPITYKRDWFELRYALLQFRPYQRPYLPTAVASVQSPAGVTLLGKHGAVVLTITVPRDPSAGSTDLSVPWASAQESEAAHGLKVKREDWRFTWRKLEKRQMMPGWARGG